MWTRFSFWLVSSLIYLTLIYSTGLHSAYGPERLMDLSFMIGPTDGSPPDALFEKHFPHYAALCGKGLSNLRSMDLWKLTTFYADAGLYILQAKSFDLAIPPFKYRIVPTIIVSQISDLMGSRNLVPLVYGLLNAITVFVTAHLFASYLTRYLNFSRLYGLIGAMLLITTLSLTMTTAFPMLEPMSFLFVTLMFIAAISKNTLLFVVSSVLGVATKETLVIFSLVWLVNHFRFTKGRLTENAAAVLVSSVPVLAFFATRVALGGAIDEVSYGYRVFSGEFPPQWQAYLFDREKALGLILRIFLSFSFLWIGLYNFRKNDFLMRSSIIVVPAIIAASLLSSCQSRTLGILFPILIPLFLYFLPRRSLATDSEM
jgi:hypothetical protein